MEGRRGHLGVAGMIAGAAAVLLVLDLLLPWFDVNASLKGSGLGAPVSTYGAGTVTSVVVVLLAAGVGRGLAPRRRRRGGPLRAAAVGARRPPAGRPHHPRPDPDGAARAAHA